LLIEKSTFDTFGKPVAILLIKTLLNERLATFFVEEIITGCSPAVGGARRSERQLEFLKIYYGV
jgi:hypothetical protein